MSCEISVNYINWQHLLMHMSYQRLSIIFSKYLPVVRNIAGTGIRDSVVITKSRDIVWRYIAMNVSPPMKCFIYHGRLYIPLIKTHKATSRRLLSTDERNAIACYMLHLLHILDPHKLDARRKITAFIYNWSLKMREAQVKYAGRVFYHFQW